METNILHNTECLAGLKMLPDNSIDAIITDPPYGISFMGKKRDYDVPSVEIWMECLRVLKPGGHLMAFAGTRTQHRMAVRIEDAWFEIRDMIAWVYGSWFPKSLNIGKSIENKILNGNASKNGFHNLEWERRDGRIGMYDTVEEQGFRKVNPDQLGAFDLKPTTDEWKAREWRWTALKPAIEPITLARKPIEWTVAENVLKWGTWWLNIDESRVATEDKLQSGTGAFGKSGIYGSANGQISEQSNLGRFPANLIHDNSEEVRECFPDSKGGAFPKTHGSSGFVSPEEKENRVEMNDSGNASRFFKSIIYQAKASKSERNMGCEELEAQDLVWQGLAGEHNNPKHQNNHPTVKPIALMEYLINMITKQDSIVLDPFAGCWSTLIACKKLGRQYIWYEMDAEYCKIAEARIQAA